MSQFLGSTTIYAVGYVISRLQTFLLLAVLTHFLTHEEYAAYEALVAFGILLTGLGLFAQESTLPTVVQNSPAEDQNRAANSAITLSFAASCLVLVIGYVFYKPLANLIFAESGFEREMIAFLIVAILNSWTAINNVAIRNQFKPKTSSVFLIAHAALTLTFGVYTLVIKDLGLYNFILSQIAALTIISCAYIVYNRKILTAGVDKKLLAKCWTLTAPLLPFVVVSWVLNYSDRLFLSQFRSLEEVGLYGIAARVASITGILLGPFQLVWLPYAMNKLKNSEEEATFPAVFRAYLLMGIFVVSSLGLLAPLIIRVLAPESYWHASHYVAILAFCNFIFLFYYFPLAVFLQNSKPHLGPIAFAMGAGANLLINYIFVSKYGIFTLLYSNAIGFLLMIFLSWIWSQRIQKIAYPLFLAFAAGIPLLLLAVAETIWGNSYRTVFSGLWILLLIPTSWLLWQQVNEYEIMSLIPGRKPKKTEVSLDQLQTKKALIIVESYPDGKNYGMTFVHSRNLIFKDRNIEFDVLSFKARNSYTYEGIQVLTEKDVRRKVQKGMYSSIFSHAPNIKNHIRFLILNALRNQHTVFFFHGHEVLNKAKYYSPPYLAIGSYWYKVGSWTNRIYDIFKLTFLRWYFEQVSDRNSQFVFVSQWMKDHFLKNLDLPQEFAKGRCQIIPNPAHQSFFDSHYSFTSPKVADFITIRPFDNPKYAIDLVVEIARQNPENTFHVYGQGSYFKNINVPHNLKVFEGYLEQKDIPAILNKYRAALMPTRLDAQGVMMCEMATFGIPVVTSGISVCREMLAGFPNTAFISNENPIFQAKEFLNSLSTEMTKADRFSAKNTTYLEVELLRT